jgi:lauroyl/myristoyl acyltransferase
LTELAFFPAFRGAERLFSPECFHAVLRPYYHGRAVLNKGFKKNKITALPGFLGRLKTQQAVVEQRRAFYLNQIVDYFPDRLAEAKWKNRCRVEGMEHLEKATQNRRPVVLAFAHFGAYTLLRSWLRVAGIPAIVMMGGKTEERTGIRRFMDRYMLSPKVPPALYQDHWQEAVEHLKAGHPLLVAIDVRRGKQIEVPFGEGWTFQMASGAVRLAIHHQADLIPCSIKDEGAWKFRLKLGAPVPAEYLTSDAGWFSAGKYLMDEMLPDWQAHPEQCSNSLIRCLKPAAAAPIMDRCIPAP